MAEKTRKRTPIVRKHHELDAEILSLGRLACRAAILLRGKHKTSYQPNIDGGDFVDVKNASRLKITGKKIEQKKYYHHTRFQGGIKTENMKDMMKTRPEKVIINAVTQMLPKTRLRKNIMKRLTIKK